MPLLTESVNFPSKVFHCITIIYQLTAKLYVKKVQWLKVQCVIMLESIYIEMAFLAAIIDWVKSSGWTYVFETAQIIMVGRTE